jgi:small Trp-rich protein
MFFVLLGLVLVGMKMGDVSMVADWSWWVVLAPFAAAVVWWFYADSTGLTKRREMQKLESKKVERRRKNMAALGTGRDNRKTADAIARARELEAERLEDKRAEKRTRNETVIRNSVFDSLTGAPLDEPKDTSKPQG